MKKFFNTLLLCLFLLLLPWWLSCKSKKGAGDFTGTYKLSQVTPVDTVAPERIRQASDWVLELEVKDNFHLYGNGKNVVGYWNVQPGDPAPYRIFLQGGGVAAYADFDGTTITFTEPHLLLDRLFSRASFTRVKD